VLKHHSTFNVTGSLQKAILECPRKHKQCPVSKGFGRTGWLSEGISQGSLRGSTEEHRHQNRQGLTQKGHLKENLPRNGISSAWGVEEQPSLWQPYNLGFCPGLWHPYGQMSNVTPAVKKPWAGLQGQGSWPRPHPWERNHTALGAIVLALTLTASFSLPGEHRLTVSLLPAIALG
jgi:hypothetical protein